MTNTALILHGGGGPATVSMIAEHLSDTMRTLLPTHPGWQGTPRPDSLVGVPDLASHYLDLLAAHDVRDAVVIGSSMGGWAAAEMAVRDTEHRVGALILINAVGIEVPGQPITDYFALGPRAAAEHSYHDPDRFFVDPATMPAERVALMRGNLATLKAIAGDMCDPGLAARLAEVAVPTLVLWGGSDRIVTPAYGRAYARAFGAAEFALISAAGHLPQIEQPAATFAAIDAFLRGSSR